MGEDDQVELLGVTFYGSPYQPEFCDWAFNMERGEPLKKEWAKIPDHGIDVLITHGPPKYHGDKVAAQMVSHNDCEYVGCEDLRERMKEIEDVKFHVFGHIHEGYGVTRDKEIKGVTFINASTVDLRYKVSNKPIMFYVKGRGRQYSDRQRVVEEEEEQKHDVAENQEENVADVNQENDVDEADSNYQDMQDKEEQSNSVEH